MKVFLIATLFRLRFQYCLRCRWMRHRLPQYVSWRVRGRRFGDGLFRVE